MQNPNQDQNKQYRHFTFLFSTLGLFWYRDPAWQPWFEGNFSPYYTTFTSYNDGSAFFYSVAKTLIQRMLFLMCIYPKLRGMKWGAVPSSGGMLSIWKYFHCYLALYNTETILIYFEFLLVTSGLILLGQTSVHSLFSSWII